MSAINQLKYSQMFEKLMAQGASTEEAHEKANEYATVKLKKANEYTMAKPEQRQKKRGRSSLAKLIVRKARELRYGSKTYLYETPQERRKRVLEERKE